jgi:hypothetical protein
MLPAEADERLNPRPKAPDPVDAAVRLMHELDALKTDGPVQANTISRVTARLIDLAVVFPAAIVIIAAIDTAAIASGANLRDEDLRPTGAGTFVG